MSDYPEQSDETLENIRQIMLEIGLDDGVAFADIVKAGDNSPESRVFLNDFQESLGGLRRSGMIDSSLSEALLAEAKETITFFNSKYCE